MLFCNFKILVFFLILFNNLKFYSHKTAIQAHREFMVISLKVFESAGKYPPAVSIDLVLLGSAGDGDFPTDASNNITQLGSRTIRLLKASRPAGDFWFT